jgi:hypothetical protein
MSNNKQTSIDWFFDQLVLNRIIVINGSTYWDKVKTKYETLLDQAREMHREEIETAAIISSAEQSTSAASANTEAFGIGYDQGYKRALELLEWKIQNELNELKNTK